MGLRRNTIYFLRHSFGEEKALGREDKTGECDSGVHTAGEDVMLGHRGARAIEAISSIVVSSLEPVGNMHWHMAGTATGGRSTVVWSR